MLHHEIKMYKDDFFEDIKLWLDFISGGRLFQSMGPTNMERGPMHVLDLGTCN